MNTAFVPCEERWILSATEPGFRRALVVVEAVSDERGERPLVAMDRVELVLGVQKRTRVATELRGEEK